MPIIDKLFFVYLHYLVNGHGVRLIDGNGLGNWYGLRHGHQLDGLHGHRTEVSSVAETVASKAGWGGAVTGKAETTVEEKAVSVASAEATSEAVTSQATVADKQSRVGDGQRDESGDLKKILILKFRKKGS